MKKLVSTILALGIILSTLTACESTPQQDVTTKTPPTKYTTEGKTNELVPDETATGELVVADYIFEFEKEKYNLMEKIYNELYPNVKLTMDLTIYDYEKEDLYFNKLATEVMAGKGPDVFDIMSQDVHKMMKSGALADLTEYFENDKAFDVSKYNETVLYGGQFQGKQYVVPTGYTIPTVYGFSDEINETGIEVNKCKDYYTAMEQFLPVIKEYGLSTTIYPISYLPAIYNGLDIFDYENNCVNLDNDLLKKNFEITKEVINSYEINLAGNILNINYATNLYDITGQRYSKTIASGKEAFMIPLKNAKGGITADPGYIYAVNASSENKQNAYNFIKMMMHPDFLKKAYQLEPCIVGIPLSNEYIEHILDMATGSTEYSKQFDNNFYDMLDSINEVNVYYKMNEIFLYEIMPQYFNDEKTLDECLEEAQTRLEIYISE